MKKLKNILLLNKGMAIINTLFFLSLLIKNSGVVFAFYLVWLLYLVAAFKESRSKTVKVVNVIFMAFAATMLAVNVCLWLRLI